jgi:hypothetical protein
MTTELSQQSLSEISALKADPVFLQYMRVVQSKNYFANIEPGTPEVGT